ncbi:MAG: SDR family oxidoreductase [Planctomycetota bacterium]|nr:SDR family oxidoreductase [Planctomycetota bacterium]
MIRDLSQPNRDGAADVTRSRRRESSPGGKPRDYHLLTGATGLLGSYLLRDALRTGKRIAALARPSKWESARQRIETSLARWERETGEILPRPTVLEGSLALDRWEPRILRWVTEHCQSVIHNAASLTFQTTADGEPWVSNVEGTRAVLELCRRTSIRQFHHVSTAYVCGLRDGRVLESELDVGQTPGNDYEASKCEAEKLVRTADFLDRPTIYRPSIIVGDSQTGYTSTFHGFYVPIKLAHTLVNRLVLGATSGQRAVAAIGLQGPEGKNFVPVDWVSAVITHIHGHPEHRGRTYHLTSPRAVKLAEIAAVIQDAVERYSTLADANAPRLCDSAWFEQNLAEQMAVYRSYWRDDPDFDCTNTLAAATHLPCPPMHHERLLLLARHAIQSGFGRPRPRPICPEFDVHSRLEHLLAAGRELDAESTSRPRVGLQVDGRGGGQWELVLNDGRPVAAKEGLTRCSEAVCRLTSETYERLVHRRVSVGEALQSGLVVIEGKGMDLRQLAAVFEPAVFETTVTGGGQPLECVLVNGAEEFATP